MVVDDGGCWFDARGACWATPIVIRRLLWRCGYGVKVTISYLTVHFVCLSEWEASCSFDRAGEHGSHDQRRKKDVDARHKAGHDVERAVRCRGVGDVGCATVAARVRRLPT